jgi:hypothetical protein
VPAGFTLVFVNRHNLHLLSVKSSRVAALSAKRLPL